MMNKPSVKKSIIAVVLFGITMSCTQAQANLKDKLYKFANGSFKIAGKCIKAPFNIAGKCVKTGFETVRLHPKECCIILSSVIASYAYVNDTPEKRLGSVRMKEVEYSRDYVQKMQSKAKDFEKECGRSYDMTYYEYGENYDAKQRIRNYDKIKDNIISWRVPVMVGATVFATLAFILFLYELKCNNKKSDDTPENNNITDDEVDNVFVEE